MNKTIILLAALTLSGCVSLQFDSLEYDRYISIKETADNAILLCGDSAVLHEVKLLKQSTDHQFLYSSNRSSRPQVATAATNLKTIVDGLYNRYQNGTPTESYCREKLKNVSIGASTVVSTLGRL